MIRILTFGFSVLFLVGGCQLKEEGRELKLAHGLDVTHSVHRAMVFMNERLVDYSDGQLSMTIYPSQQLGSERELLELLQLGAVDLTKSSCAVVESFAPDIKLFSVPYLFRSDEHMHKILDGQIGRELLERTVPYYMRGLCFYDAGKRSFYTKTRRVDSPGDLKGMKIRVQASQSAIRLVNSFGAAATPISFGELYTALQQGVVDGAENNPPSFYLTRHYEVCKYYILNEHTAVPDVLLISEHTWKKLSSQEQEWVKKAARDSYQYQKQLWKASETEALAAVEAAGVEIIRPDKAQFAQASASVLDAMLTTPQLKALYQRIQEIE